MDKFLLIFICCALSSVSIVRSECDKEELINNDQIIREECRKEFNVSDSDLLEMEERDQLTDAGKCMQACIYKKKQIMNENGLFDRSRFMNLGRCLSDNNVFIISVLKNASDICEKEVLPVDHCEASAALQKCLYASTIEKLKS